MLVFCCRFLVTVKQKMWCRLCSVVHVEGLSRLFFQTKIPLFLMDVFFVLWRQKFTHNRHAFQCEDCQ